MTWRDDDREYKDFWEAAKGGWRLLNREERIAFGFLWFITTLLVLLGGTEIGHYIDPNQPIIKQTVKEEQVTPDRLVCKTCATSGEEWLYCKYDEHGAVLVETPEWCEVTDEHVQLDMREGQLSGVLTFQEESRGDAE